MSSTSPMSSTDTATDSSSCPTANTTSFAKTRFVGDVSSTLFLLNRYVVNPFQAGTFTKGASGRTRAIIKAGLAVAASAKLLKNAAANAEANPTLCKTVAAPLKRLTSSLGGVVDGLKSGSLSAGAISGLGGLLSSVKDEASKAGFPVSEKQTSL